MFVNPTLSNSAPAGDGTFVNQTTFVNPTTTTSKTDVPYGGAAAYNDGSLQTEERDIQFKKIRRSTMLKNVILVLGTSVVLFAFGIASTLKLLDFGVHSQIFQIMTFISGALLLSRLLWESYRYCTDPRYIPDTGS